MLGSSGNGHSRTQSNDTSIHRLGQVLLLLLEGDRSPRNGSGGGNGGALELGGVQHSGITSAAISSLARSAYVVYLDRDAGAERLSSGSKRRGTGDSEGRLLLTDAGRRLGRYIRKACSTCSASGDDATMRCVQAIGLGPSFCVANGQLVPYWDGRTSHLWAGPVLVKHFCKRAPNQMRLLDAFEQANWTSRIDDPLPSGDYDADPKQRLRDTIKDLNSSLHTRVIRFRGDGTGRGVLWEFVCTT